jgi:hypothetical protein
MNLEDLGNLGESLSGIAVVFSLIYLIFEVRRNTRSIRTKSAWDATNALAELCEHIAPNQQLSDVVRRAHDPGTKLDDLTPAEFTQFLFVARSVLFKYEAQWHLWEEGSLSDTMWQQRRLWAKAFISLPVPGRVWDVEIESHQYHPGFVESIESAQVRGDLTISAESP